MWRMAREAFTMVELMVGVLIFGLLLAAISTLYFSVNRQGVKQDRETATWYTFSGAMEALREDLAQATELEVSDSKIEMTTMTIGEDLKFITANVIWAQAAKSKLTRSSGGKKTTFDFGSSLPPKDAFNMRFAQLP